MLCVSSKREKLPKAVRNLFYPPFSKNQINLIHNSFIYCIYIYENEQELLPTSRL